MSIEKIKNLSAVRAEKEKNIIKVEKQIVPEGVYNIEEAVNIYEQQIIRRNKILKKIDDEEYNIRLLGNLYKLSFKNVKADIAAKHIMHRVLVGTMFNYNEEKDGEFIFDHIDTEVEEIFQKIVMELNKDINTVEVSDVSKRRIDNMIREYFREKGILEEVH